MDDELKQGVAEVAPVEETEQVVNTDEETTPVQNPQEQAEETSTQEVKPEVIKDSRPIENVAWETKRKIDELYPKVDKIFEFIQNQGQHQPQQQSYSKAQLMAYASEPTTTTEQRLWAYGEVDKLEKREREQEYERIVKTTQTKTETESRRAQSSGWVAKTFPETVVKDREGNPIGWNTESPLYQRASTYMARNESLRNDPDGFMAAVKMAAFDLGVSPIESKKTDRAIGQLRKEQKKQLASSGGTRVADTNADNKQVKLQKLMELHRKTQDPSVLEQIVKMRGLNPFA